MIDAFKGAAQNDESLALVNPAEWEGFTLELAEKAPEVLGAAFQVLKTQASRNKLLIMEAAGAFFISALGTIAAIDSKPPPEVAHKYIFREGLFGHPSQNSDEKAKDKNKNKPRRFRPQLRHPRPVTHRALSTRTRYALLGSGPSQLEPPAYATKPACDDPDCKGDKKICQAEVSTSLCAQAALMTLTLQS